MTNNSQTPGKKQILAALALLVGVGLVLFSWQMNPDDFREETATPVTAAHEQTIHGQSLSTQETAIPAIEPKGRILGNPDAPVKIVEYASLTCGHCGKFHNDVLPEFRKKFVDTGRVSIEFREFPLNKPALEASLILNCLPEDQYYSFMSMLFSTQENWAYRSDYIVPLRQNAKLAGMGDAAFDSCLADKAKETALGEQIKEATDKYKISSTPTFVFNDGQETLSGARSIQDFEDIINRLSPPQESTPSQP